jgi:cell division protease FtsH
VDVDLDLLARRTPTMSGAQLEQVCNEAALEAARRGLVEVDYSCFSAAVEFVVMGRPRRSAVVSDRDRRTTAWHEAGHTVAALCHPFAARPVSVSIVPRGQAGGVTWMEGSDDHLLSRDQLRAQLVVALAGRVAEEMLLAGEHTAGASNDLEQATRLAQAMVDRLGMTGRGLAVRDRHTDLSGVEVDGLLAEAYETAERLLGENRGLLEGVVEALLERDDLDARDLQLLADLHGVGQVFQQPAAGKTPAVTVAEVSGLLGTGSGGILQGGGEALAGDLTWRRLLRRLARDRYVCLRSSWRGRAGRSRVRVLFKRFLPDGPFGSQKRSLE